MHFSLIASPFILLCFWNWGTIFVLMLLLPGILSAFDFLIPCSVFGCKSLCYSLWSSLDFDAKLSSPKGMCVCCVRNEKEAKPWGNWNEEMTMKVRDLISRNTSSWNNIIYKRLEGIRFLILVLFFPTNSHFILCPSDTKVLSFESLSSSTRFAPGLIMKRMGGDVSLSLFDSPGDSLHSRWISLFRWRQSHTTVLSFETDSCSLLLFLMMHPVSPFFTPLASCFSSISLSSHDFC